MQTDARNKNEMGYKLTQKWDLCIVTDRSMKMLAQCLASVQKRKKKEIMIQMLAIIRKGFENKTGNNNVTM